MNGIARHEIGDDLKVGRITDLDQGRAHLNYRLAFLDDLEYATRDGRTDPNAAVAVSCRWRPRGHARRNKPLAFFVSSGTKPLIGLQDASLVLDIDNFGDGLDRNAGGVTG